MDILSVETDSYSRPLLLLNLLFKLLFKSIKVHSLTAHENVLVLAIKVFNLIPINAETDDAKQDESSPSAESTLESSIEEIDDVLKSFSSKSAATENEENPVFDSLIHVWSFFLTHSYRRSREFNER